MKLYNQFRFHLRQMEIGKKSICQRNASFLGLIFPTGDPPQWPLKVFTNLSNDFQWETFLSRDFMVPPNLW